MTNLADRLEQALNEKKRTDRTASRAGLARYVGISKTAVGKWFNGDTQIIDPRYAPKAAEYLGVNERWLQHGQGTMSAGEAATGHPSEDGEALRLQRVRLFSEQLYRLVGGMSDQEAEETLKIMSEIAEAKAMRHRR
ncbi:helix-turn-helix domain-containing protein [Chitiniphilus purpureus]|uniref:Helix-turn-helix domain-containing protein n=1 Tax=Chitiniphilus purpureus TaxID=2981137 RepID=A0ABY6DKJ7_9NEIS|nr:helix-turn-helix domain-containing protein [Chitiniphilus sp. CD1]UXY14763.1 helix-turn-helix domain-containing protein [Chitiniphilus sp. CD1]